MLRKGNLSKTTPVLVTWSAAGDYIFTSVLFNASFSSVHRPFDGGRCKIIRQGMFTLSGATSTNFHTDIIHFMSHYLGRYLS